MNDSINGSNGFDELNLGEGNDTAFGWGGNDYLYGGAGFDSLDGGSGNDTLGGGTGNDVLYGQSGNDVVEGGQGFDYMVGGTGSDTFRFYRGDLVNPASTGGRMDHIADFTGAGIAGGDNIQLIGFGTGARVEFASYHMQGTAAENQAWQYYSVYAGDGTFEGMLFVQMADGTAQFGASDVLFYNP